MRGVLRRLLGVEARLRELEDRQAIRDLLHQYARGADTRDFPLLAACFLEDGRFEYPGVFEARGRREIERQVSGLRRWRVTQHLMGRETVTLRGDTATAETYAIAFHRGAAPEGGERDYVMGIRYADDLVRTREGWRISRHVLNLDWTVGESLARPER